MFSSTTGTDISAIPNYTKACAVSCSQGLPNPSNTRCCPTTGFPTGTTITSFTSDDCSTYTVTCAGGPIANSTNTRCCPAVSTPTGTTIVSYTDNCVTPTCGKTDGTGDFINTVSGATGPTCNYTCLTPVTNNQTSVVVNSDTTVSGVVLPAQDSTFTALASPLTGIAYTYESSTATTKVQTNIGSYYFFPRGSEAAVYTGSGTPTPTYAAPTTTSIAFPFKVNIESMQFWVSGVTSVSISLKKNYGGTEVLIGTLAFSTSPSTFTNSTQAYGKYLTLTFTGTGQVAYKIRATVRKICTAVCSPPSTSVNLGRAVLDTGVIPEDSSRTCMMLCNPGFSPIGTGCSACPATTLYPGTSVGFDSSCGGNCSVFDPTAANSANTLANATAASSGVFSTSSAGTCQINACPTDRTKYTSATGTTLNNSGCCPIPTIVDTVGAVLTGTGITWSYPSGSSSTSTSTGTCSLTCTLPSTNTYGMTVSSSSPATNTRVCVRACTAVTAPTGFTVSRGSVCDPICALSTADTNAGTPTASYNAGTVSCTKTCKLNYGKDNSTTANDVSVCCATPTFGTNTKVGSYGTTSCNANPCAIVDNTSTYCTATYNSGTCSSTCKTRRTGADDVGTTGSYSTNGLCTFSCTKTLSVSDTNASASAGTDPSQTSTAKCFFNCASGTYKVTNSTVALC